MFEVLPALPADPILGLSLAYRQDDNPNKVDLGVGVYKTEAGHTPILAAVKAAEQAYSASEDSKVYIAPAGVEGANSGIQALLFGQDHDRSRIRTLQTPGGCGALRVAAEFIRRANPKATIWVSDPTWANHIPLLGDADIAIETYPYYDSETHDLRFDDMMSCLAQVGRGDLVLLHGCCHNPCGADLSREQWQAVAALAQKNGFTPFIDMAYQGFGSGLEEDAYGLRLLVDSVDEVIVASSCSKNFGLYRERTGALSLVSANNSAADIGLSQMLNVARGIYSMPPAHGSALVAAILQDDKLYQQWTTELGEMRQRIKSLRSLLAQQLQAKGAQQDFGFIEQQSGMFSFLGINPTQVQRLKNEFSIYMTDSSRINIAGINQHNIDYLAESICRVL